MSEMVEVRMLVGVDAQGQWHGCGWSGAARADMQEPAENCLGSAIRWSWVTAMVPKPVEVTVQGETRDGND